LNWSSKLLTQTNENKIIIHVENRFSPKKKTRLQNESATATQGK